jgi:predicted nucleic acid-binding protein
MIVVSDASPITSLLQTGQAGLLRGLFDEVLMPPAVEAELLRFHAELPDWLVTRPILGQQQADLLSRLLDRGEAEAIVLAEECHADYLLIDEKRGRQQAEARGLTAIGLLGVLLLAKRAGQLASVSDLIDRLETQAGFFVSEHVKSIILRAAGELA